MAVQQLGAIQPILIRQWITANQSKTLMSSLVKKNAVVTNAKVIEENNQRLKLVKPAKLGKIKLLINIVMVLDINQKLE